MPRAIWNGTVVAESDTSRLNPQRTAAQLAERYGTDATASCRKKRGYWDYTCRVHRSASTFSVVVRVDEHKIVDRSGP